MGPHPRTSRGGHVDLRQGEGAGGVDANGLGGEIALVRRVVVPDDCVLKGVGAGEEIDGGVEGPVSGDGAVEVARR